MKSVNNIQKELRHDNVVRKLIYAGINLRFSQHQHDSVNSKYIAEWDKAFKEYIMNSLQGVCKHD